MNVLRKVSCNENVATYLATDENCLLFKLIDESVKIMHAFNAQDVSSSTSITALCHIITTLNNVLMNMKLEEKADQKRIIVSVARYYFLTRYTYANSFCFYISNIYGFISQDFATVEPWSQVLHDSFMYFKLLVGGETSVISFAHVPKQRNSTAKAVNLILDAAIVPSLTMLASLILFNNGSNFHQSSSKDHEFWIDLARIVFSTIKSACKVNCYMVQKSFDEIPELFHLMLFWLERNLLNSTSLNSLIDEIVEVIGLVFSF